MIIYLLCLCFPLVYHFDFYNPFYRTLPVYVEFFGDYWSISLFDSNV